MAAAVRFRMVARVTVLPTASIYRLGKKEQGRGPRCVRQQQRRRRSECDLHETGVWAWPTSVTGRRGGAR